ncbi:MAG: TRAP transporter large permease subunit [Sneathiella sp.]
MLETVIILLVLFGLLFAGIPIAFALGGLGAMLLYFGDFSSLMAPQTLYSAMDSFVLIAVPLFLLMSNILLKAGVGKDLFGAAQAWVGHLPGGLAVATVLSCGVFAAVSGSSVATAATIGVVSIPEMIQRGYSRKFALGLLAAGGTLGILIPPSIPMIVYGVVTEESILDMFLAGIGPGILLIVLFCGFSMLYAKFDKRFQMQPKADWAERKLRTKQTLPTLVLVIIMLGGLYAGVFTPSEAGGVGFVCALLLTTVIQRRLSWSDFKEALIDSMKTTVTILLIVAGAKIFGKAITLYQLPQEFSTLIADTFQSQGSMILAICLSLLVFGLFLEALSMMLIMVPLLLPTLLVFGVDPIWFGIVFVIMIECALITPPVGLNIYVIQAVGKATMAEVSAGVWPFVLLMLLSVVAVYFFPAIALYIPFSA